MEYSFHVFNQHATDGVTMSIETLLKNDLAEKLTPSSLLPIKKNSARARENTRFQKTFNGDFSTPPVIVCVGSDLAIGDSLGPITGSMLKHKTQGLGVFIYGTLGAPVTAKEIKYLRPFLKQTHPSSQIIAIDAAVGAEGDIGLIKLSNTPLFPGSGANKKLGAVGDISIMGIVAEKSLANYGLLNTTRLNLVYTMAQIISDGISAVLWERAKSKDTKPLDKQETEMI
jgi:putative sporulation protein YyaC